MAEYESTIGQRNRICIPCDIIEEIKSRNPGIDEIVLRILPIIEDGDAKYIKCYDPRGWIEEGKRRSSELNVKAREARVETLNRIVIPRDIRKKLALNQSITIVYSNNPNCFEIWSREKFTKYMQKEYSDYNLTLGKYFAR